MDVLKRTARECRSFLMSWDNDRWNSGRMSAEFHQNNSTQIQDGGQLANSRGTELILAGDRDSITPQSLQRPFSDGAGLEPKSFSIKVFPAHRYEPLNSLCSCSMSLFRSKVPTWTGHLPTSVALRSWPGALPSLLAWIRSRQEKLWPHYTSEWW